MALDTKVRFEPWERFRQRPLRQGEHILTIGTTGSGKTVLERELVKDIDWTVLLGTKNSDKELYGAFEEVGFEIVDEFDPEPEREHSRVIFRPRLTSAGRSGVGKQTAAFAEMLDDILAAGGWHVVCDELWTLDNRLHLTTQLETFWTAGRSEGITVVGATQEPVYIPRLAYTASTHLFFFGNPDEERIDRMAALSAGHRAEVKELLPILPEHEFLYINTRTRAIVRSKVNLRA